ncbi:MAG: signal recognition particle protein [Bacteroidota bacterium]|nr:signal recognition particle protein [Bacteroidota bacterium]
MFQNLTEKLERAFKILKGQGKITEVNIADTLKEVRRALLDADVDYKIAKNFADNVKMKAIGSKVLTNINPGQLLIKIVKDELTLLMGENSSELALKSNPSIILMSGLQGSGKTTFSGKIGKYLKNKKSKKPLLVACDTYRPAAIDQLETIANENKIDIYLDREEKQPNKIAKKSIDFAKKNGNNVVIIDTAGRLAVDKKMMQEISDIKKVVNPDETLFVIDSMVGQDAVKTAKSFNDILDFDGVVLTKLDGDTRGGVALSVKSSLNKPIKFVGTGEKMDAIDLFYPDRMAERILGMGDVVTLVERAQEQYDQEEARKISKKIAKNKFDYDDFLSQIKKIKKMGDMKDLIGMIPGAGKHIKNIDIDENIFKNIEVIISSMTIKERQNPELINISRKNRISKGSGRSIDEVNQLIKQFNQMSKMMKMMKSNKSANMMNMFNNFR